MNKSLGMLGVFAVGVAVGVIATRLAGAPDTAAAPGRVDAPPPTPGVSAPAAPPAAAKPATLGQALAARAADRPPPPVAPAPPLPDAQTPIQPIDAGEVFNKLIGRPPQPGFVNDIGDAHHALEREMRDEGWAFTMESELQNALVNELSVGAFRVEHVECRATMCELRLSAQGDEQAESLSRWSDGLAQQPFGQRLLPNYSSSITEDGRTDRLIIFRRPPRPR